MFITRVYGTLGLVVLAGACAYPEEAATDTGSDAIVGRWDVSARQGDRSYPLWFEVSRSNGELAGRFQPRGGHALQMDRIDISGSQLEFQVGEATMSGVLEGGVFKGTGQTSRGSALEWSAVRAPELPAVENPKWGQPIALFNGRDLSGWKPRHESEPNLWSAQEGVLVNSGRGSDILTTEKFKDFRLQIEVHCPEGSNSGIYLRGRYEVQVQDSYGTEPHSRHLGGVYGHITPTSNPAKPAGEWQSLDITLLGRWVTVELNGVKIIDHQEIPGITGGALDSNESEPGPILIQGDHGAVSYRNITLTPVVSG